MGFGRHPGAGWDPSLLQQQMPFQMKTDMDPSLRWDDEVVS